MPGFPERSARTIVRSAPAKVNLFLELLAKRADGFHEIETLMVAVSLADTLTVMSAADLSLTCSDPTLPVGDSNLVVKAAKVLQGKTGCTSGATIHLEKRIPAEAGLAGGSSDAAATLLALNELWDLQLANESLCTIAADIGSDVAFFLNLPSAWCTGRGEVVTPVQSPAELHFVLVCPPFGISTPAVYKGVTVPESPKLSAK
ncbi:MAG: 4-(cytidine 5'-diphospho)-2-C-methyl-D-erythritol kinase, partial [Candidatus Udaeobacter sp.]